MKFYHLLIACILFSCGKGVSTEDSTVHYSNTNNLDTLILGIHFGMSEEEYSNLMKEKLAEGKLEIKDNYYNYTFEFKSTDFIPAADAIFGATYHEDKLWKLRMEIEGRRSNDMSVILYDQLNDLYTGKYGYWDDAGTNVVGDLYSTWYFSNAEIYLFDSGSNVVIIYTNTEEEERIKNIKPDVSDL